MSFFLSVFFAFVVVVVCVLCVVACWCWLLFVGVCCRLPLRVAVCVLVVVGCCPWLIVCCLSVLLLFVVVRLCSLCFVV